MSQARALPYLLLAPSVLFLALFFLYPLVETIALSLTGPSGFSFANYARMAGDINFGAALQNTFLLVAVVVPLQLAFALAMAQMRTIPLGVSDLAAGLVWLALLTDRGYLNTILYGLGLIDGPTGWLSYETPVTLFFAIVIAEVWRATAIVLVILVAGLGLIPKEYDEAAQIFGATPWQRFVKITLPLMKPSIQTALILRTVLAFEVFAVVFALGGRNFPVLVGEAYVWQFDNQNYGVAAAYAVLVMAISLIATAVYLRVLRTPPEARG
jgi:multiple sugar transport system permease protein